MFTDEKRYHVHESIRQQGLQAFRQVLNEAIIQETIRRTKLKVVQCALCAPNLIWLGISAALHHTQSFADVLVLSVRLLDLSPGGPPEPVRKARRTAKRRRRNSKRSKHDPHGGDPATLAEEAFVKARAKMPAVWWEILMLVLTEQFEAEYAHLVHWKGFRLLALDGTTITLPPGRRLTEHFGTAGNGKSRTTQARMVMMQLPFVRLPWRYELCPIHEAEQPIAERLLRHVRGGDLVLMDRGFFSYGLFCQLQKSGAFFGVRKTGSMKLGRAKKRFGPHDRLYEWKKPSGPRWRGLDLPESITLRVIDYQIPGFRPSAVVTNVLDPERLSRDDWVRVTTHSEAGRPLERRVRLRQGLYHRRWEIETTFHELKVTQKMEQSLRSHTPKSIRYEIAGHVVLYLLTRWLMAKAAQAAEPDGDPLGLSFKHAFEILTTSWPLLLTARPGEVPGILRKMMQQIAAGRVPWRPGRHVSRPGDTQTKNLGNGKFKQPHKLESKPE